MSNIFKNNAAEYWAAGLPVMPLHAFDANVKSPGKAPILTGWQEWCSKMPSESVQEHWLHSYPNANIGLPFGSASGLCAIDIDTTDEELIEAIESCLPASPWRRIGQKGCGLIYRWQGQRNFKIKTADNESIVEFLGNGNQMVVPPSIHPKTREPYVSNVNLFDVMSKIQLAPLDIEERLRAALAAAGVKLGIKGRSAPLDIIPSGERDTQMTRHAGYLARVVLGIDKQAQYPLQEAIDHMYNWVAAFTLRVPGDEMDPTKGVAKLLEFLLKDLEKGRTLPEAWDADMHPDWINHPSIEALTLKNTRSRWTVSRAREWLASKIAERPQNEDWVLARLIEMIALVAADENFVKGDMLALTKRILPTIAGLGLTKGDLSQMFNDARRRGGGDDVWEDQEVLARQVIAELEKGGELRFCFGQFYRWSGARWEALDRSEVYLQATSIKGSLLLRRNSDFDAIVKVCEQLLPRELVLSEEKGLNFANGWVGLDLKLVDHDPKYGATFTLPFNFLGDDVRCPRFFDFLSDCWGRDPDFLDKVALLREAIAASMYGLLPTYQKAILLHGRPGTGKTVLMEILRSLLPPDAIGDVGPLRWGERFALAGLVNKSVNICGELPETGYIPGHLFKQIIEGSSIEIERKGQDTFSYKPTAGHWFGSNYLPATKDSSEGFIRRWRILGFDWVVPDAERIVGLHEQIVAEEREGIASWALQGLPNLLERGQLPEPSSHLALVAEMRRINNSVLAWLESNGTYSVTKNMNDSVLGSDLYDRYTFHVRNVNRGVTAPYERFIQMLYDMGLDRKQVRDAHGALAWHVSGVRART